MIRIKITDTLDLHGFDPNELPMLLEDYIDESLDRGFRQVRIIHGKGKGILRERVHSLIRRNPHVTDYMLAPPHNGGWGATIVYLKRSTK